VLVAFQLGTEERPRVALLWIAAQSLALLAILEFRFGIEHAVGILAAYFPFQLLAFYTSRVFAELLATREKLAANSRAAERLRISRELHDVFGHRLAAVNVNLEVASRVPDAEKLRFVERAHASAKALLNDVREVVANLRRDSPVDLRELMQSVISDVPRPAIHLDCDANACVEAESAQLLVRSAQEIVTNSMKHSTSENLWMRLRIRDGAVEFVAEDDGCGAREVHERSGLRGMRERVEGAGGSLHIAAGDGFRIELVVPGAAA
jgi:signal transduction histidine kinase